jgi:dynein heavy chain
LTALLQTSARRNGVSIDSLTWEFIVRDEHEFRGPPEEGAYISGLYLEGAKWNQREGHLSEPGSELYSPMPVIHFKPTSGQDTAVTNKYYR